MKILVTGGAGFIGSALIPRLLDRGYEVDVLDLLWFGRHLPNQVKVIEKDVMDVTVDDLDTYDTVLFLAGLSNDPMAEYSPAKNYIGNASAPAYLAYVAKRAGVNRYIYASSCSVYGYAVDRLYDEDAPTNSSYPYGISKLQGEYGCFQVQDDDFSVISLRQGTVCGYSPRMRFDLVINTMFKCAVLDGTINVSNPSIWRPVLAIQDSVSAFIRAIESNQGISGIFNVASGNYTLGELADLVAAGVRENLDINAKISIDSVSDLRNYKVSIDRANNILGFHPRWDAKRIIAELAENLDSFGDFMDPAFYNIQTFKALGK